MPRLILFNKPFGVLSQFTDSGTDSSRQTLSEFIRLPGVYPAGRLDRDSEGILLLTNDGPGANRFLHPRFGVTKERIRQIEAKAMTKLREILGPRAADLLAG